MRRSWAWPEDKKRAPRKVVRRYLVIGLFVSGKGQIYHFHRQIPPLHRPFRPHPGFPAIASADFANFTPYERQQTWKAGDARRQAKGAGTLVGPAALPANDLFAGGPVSPEQRDQPRDPRHQPPRDR